MSRSYANYYKLKCLQVMQIALTETNERTDQSKLSGKFPPE